MSKNHPLRHRKLSGWSLVSVLAGAAALVSCYGTLLLLAVFSLLGISLGLDEGLWVASILTATVVALVALAVNFRRHGRPWPLLVAAAGTAMIFYVMLGSYHIVLEALGFLLLVAGILLDLLGSGRGRLHRTS